MLLTSYLGTDMPHILSEARDPFTPVDRIRDILNALDLLGVLKKSEVREWADYRAGLLLVLERIENQANSRNKRAVEVSVNKILWQDALINRREGDFTIGRYENAVHLRTAEKGEYAYPRVFILDTADRRMEYLLYGAQNGWWLPPNGILQGRLYGAVDMDRAQRKWTDRALADLHVLVWDGFDESRRSRILERITGNGKSQKDKPPKVRKRSAHCT